MSDLPGRRRLLGVLRSWLKSQADETWQPYEPPASASAISPATTHVYGPVRVLVVDDNPVNLMIISALLESRGLVPFLAADGAEAVALARELPFDLILMDLQMPVLDGMAATAAIRRLEAEHSRPAVPVIAYSSSSLTMAALARHGFNGILAKPCEDQELDDCLVLWCPAYRPAPAERGLIHEHRRRRSAVATAAAPSCVRPQGRLKPSRES